MFAGADGDGDRCLDACCRWKAGLDAGVESGVWTRLASSGVRRGVSFERRSDGERSGECGPAADGLAVQRHLLGTPPSSSVALAGLCCAGVVAASPSSSSPVDSPSFEHPADPFST